MRVIKWWLELNRSEFFSLVRIVVRCWGTMKKKSLECLVGRWLVPEPNICEPIHKDSQRLTKRFAKICESFCQSLWIFVNRFANIRLWLVRDIVPSGVVSAFKFFTLESEVWRFTSSYSLKTRDMMTWKFVMLFSQSLSFLFLLHCRFTGFTGHNFQFAIVIRRWVQWSERAQSTEGVTTWIILLK